MAPMTFFDRLSLRARRIDSLLCVGLDPRVEPGSADPAARLLDANRRVIEATADLALCYKPNIAFYEQHGPQGLEALARTIAAVPEGVPVILDAKRGDIGATAEAYAAACRALAVDAVTVSPYMGHDSVAPCPYMGHDSVAPFTVSGLAIFVLCRTSNPGAGDFQTARVDGVPLASLVAERALAWDGEVGLVVAANDTGALGMIRAAHPNAWLLAPGIGAQGGSMDEAVAAGLGRDGLGLLPVVARGISRANDPAAVARDQVERFRRARDRCAGRAPRPDAAASELLDAILDTGCLRFGEFTLKSGRVSPFYVDLRRLQSSANALRAAALAYERLLVGLRADRLAAVPVAALPLATAATLRTGVGLIYPRLPAKPHGTGNRIEGEWRPGERAVLVDDLITTGKSKLEAAAVLREEGLEVRDLVVLVERGGRAGGTTDLARAGIRVHAAATIADLAARARSRSIIDEATEGRIAAYLEEDA